ncbi:MAG: hypothetical protein K0Q73_1169 [Paenibacillus sp.]|nr:hypothetical protein [Paenibacillus sp.]
MKKLNTARIVLNGSVCINFMILIIAYFSYPPEGLMLLIVPMNILSLVMLPIACIVFEVILILKNKLNIISILFILFNVLIFFIAASYYGGMY